MIFTAARRAAPLLSILGALAIGTLNGGTASAADLTVDVSVLDADSFETRLPSGTVFMLLDGPGGLRRFEFKGARFKEDVAAGRYTLIAWEPESRAATEHALSLGPDGASLALLLNPAQEDLIPDPDEIEARLAGVAAAPVLPPSGNAGIASVPAPSAPAERQQDPRAAPQGPSALEGAFRIRRAFRPGQPFVVELPRRPAASGDLIVVRDENPGWLQSEERGGADTVTLFAPETPGVYTVEYLAAPDLEPAAILTIEVR